MTLVDKVRCLLLSALTFATLAGCGPPNGEPGRPGGPSAPFRPATALDASPPKDADPAGALPSQVTSGEAAAFNATSTDAGALKYRDTTGSLPGKVAAGTSAPYAPEGAQGPSSAPGTPLARMAKP